MNSRTVLIAVVGWMAVLVVGWAVLFSGGDDSRSEPAGASRPSTSAVSPPASSPNEPAAAPGRQDSGSAGGQVPSHAAGVPLTPEQAAATDPQDSVPELRREMEETAKRYALLQKLPYTANGYLIEHADVDSTGKMIVRVAYPGTKREAARVYRTLLRKTGDSGSEYIVRYEAR